MNVKSCHLIQKANCISIGGEVAYNSLHGALADRTVNDANEIQHLIGLLGKSHRNRAFSRLLTVPFSSALVRPYGILCLLLGPTL